MSVVTARVAQTLGFSKHHVGNKIGVRKLNVGGIMVSVLTLSAAI
jgi:methylmalonyl-CoA mutase cobalamin-binding subunit